ncbi:hypothetical protein HX799_09140 [Pseudomonas tolaasii]|uniref:hypothetical protein n=1 Tax=Pseudomonas tolaasii TaxID=29442 RepID=UPI0015C1B6C5|nr:hypothetical protein [Pseudomonas tolaasii]NWC51325.1 hypothetical protein [Pseudomonas tolaasii]
MIIRWLLAPLLLVMAQGVSAEPSTYVCAVEQSVGLHFDSQTTTWVPTTFKPGHEYVLRRLSEDDLKNNKYRIFLNRDPKPNWAFFDGEMPIATCVENAINVTVCRHVTADASFDKDSRRFEIVYHGGYVDQGYWQQLKREDPKQYESLLSSGDGADALHPDDLVINIGKCNPDR